MDDFAHTYDRNMRKALGLADTASADEVLKSLGGLQRHGFRLVEATTVESELVHAFRLGAELAAQEARRLADSTDRLSDDKLARTLGEMLDSALIEDWETP
jgi:hypothetical protein